jgi:hypothetical protein
MNLATRGWPWYSVVFLLMSSALAAESVDAAWGPQGESAGAPAPALPVAAAFAAQLGAVKDPKLSSHLSRLASSERVSQTAGRTITAADLSILPGDLRAMVNAGLLRIDDAGLVQVYASPAREVGAVEDLVRLLKGRVERADSGANLVQAWIPMRALEDLAADFAVQHVRLPDYGFVQAGSVTSAGDAILRANLVRSTFAVTGSGVRVGVISDGVAGVAASQASGDLPPVVNTTTCNVVSGSDPGAKGAEGTAMLEIVHDLAPGAELWFGNFALGTGLDFNAAVACLAANTDVVVDDLSFFNVGPYDGTSFISANTSAQLANAAHPIRGYATSVGNSAADHYREAFADSGFTISQGANIWSLHRFEATAATTDFGRHFACTTGSAISCGNSLLLKSGGTVRVFLQWNDPFSGSNNDYDLFLVDEASSTVVAASTNPQTGTQPPSEMLSFTNPHAEGFFDLLIGRRHGVVRTLNVFVICNGDCVPNPLGTTLDFNTRAGSVANESDAGGGVLSVGAIAAADPGNVDIEPFSSRGPTADGRLKPDITGIDGVSVTGAGGFPSPFFGTSAAAPHVAGIMALLLQLRPDLKSGGSTSPAVARSVLSEALLTSAVHLGTPGSNDTFGAGRADAFAAAQVLTSAAGPCVEDPATACLLGGRFEVKVTWQTASGTGSGQVMNFGGQRAESDQSAFYWFFSSSNFELGLKILDACSVNQRFWVFISGLTDQGWTVHIRDSQTGAMKTYANLLGHLTATTADTTSGLSCP